MHGPLFMLKTLAVRSRKINIFFTFLVCSIFIVTQSIAQTHKPVTFSVMGDVPYSPSEETILEGQIDDHNALSPSSFMVHVGDIKAGSDPCEEVYYSIMSTRLQVLNIPTYIIPGDNEYNDCSYPVYPDQAWNYWKGHFFLNPDDPDYLDDPQGFEEHWLPDPPSSAVPPLSTTEHQDGVRPENFAFLMDGVLFIGINLVGGTIHDQNEWNLRMTDDAKWVDDQLDDNLSQVRAAVVFSQAGPECPGNPACTDRSLFFNKFLESGEDFAKPLFFVMGDQHTFVYDRPNYPRTWPSNMRRLIVDNGGDEDPIQITIPVQIDPSDPYYLVRNPFDSPNYFTVSGSILGAGRVSQSPSGGPLIEGTVVELTATPDPGSVFSHWSGDFSSTSNPGYFFMDEDKNITAHFEKDLPVEFVDFGAKAKACNITLQWSTASERNSSHFNIQRSKDGITFENIEQLPASGLSEAIKHYQFVDEKSIHGINYYRLEQVDKDQKVSYSKVVVAKAVCDFTDIDFFPNPATNQLNFKLSTTSTEKEATLVISNSFGTRLKKLRLDLTQAPNLGHIDLSEFPTGIYAVQLLIGDQVNVTKKIMVARK